MCFIQFTIGRKLEKVYSTGILEWVNNHYQVFFKPVSVPLFLLVVQDCEIINISFWVLSCVGVNCNEIIFGLLFLVLS